MKITAIASPAILVLPGDCECVFDTRSLLCTNQIYDSSQKVYPAFRRYSYSVYLACLAYDNVDSSIDDGTANLYTSDGIVPFTKHLHQNKEPL